MGFLTLVDSLFWHLLFVSSKQAHAVSKRADLLLTEEEWAEPEKFNQVTAEHKEAGARDQLLAGWKQRLVARNTGCAGEGSAVEDGDQGQGAALDMPPVPYLAD
jgi:hypothetical protein